MCSGLGCSGGVECGCSQITLPRRATDDSTRYTSRYRAYRHFGTCIRIKRCFFKMWNRVANKTFGNPSIYPSIHPSIHPSGIFMIAIQYTSTVPDPFP